MTLAANLAMRAQRVRRAPKPSEKQIQAAVVEHWRKCGLSDTLVAAIPNAGALGQPGLTSGLPDLLVIAPGLPIGFIELKRDERSKISDAQLDFQALCVRLGIPHLIVAGRDEPITILREWGVVR